ncbi:MAG: cytochrome c biogenesis protein ResB [Verrucomicrobia bacterium]|nr:cytochrome c biogenesis protein ResB [Verrucomicrobiota bacterium]
MWHRLLDAVSSLKLTIVCLTAALVLVFAGTLAQVHFGTHVVQERYFQSLFIWWPAESRIRIPVFPGGHLLGAVLVLNLLAAHLRRFRLSLRNLGMHLIHGGLILMLAGGLFTDLLSVESQMQLVPGETKNYSEDGRLTELVIVDQRSSDADRVVSIPEARLRKAGSVELNGFPFRVVIQHYYENSELRMLSNAGPGAVPVADHGVGAQIAVKELPRVTAVDGRDVKSVVIQLLPVGTDQGTASLGTWLVSEGLGGPQTFSYAGGPWRLEMRAVRYYKPYSVTLQKFTHERYPGTEIPKNFASQITLDDPGHAVHRDALIYMNHPLRYAGETYYQSGFGQDDKSSIFQVVHNPSFIAPYVACAIISFGMLIQFCQHFVGFTRKTPSPRAK